jgi:peptidoglycan hydrolase-like protein with peptidoglycan-binding domain
MTAMRQHAARPGGSSGGARDEPAAERAPARQAPSPLAGPAVGARQLVGLQALAGNRAVAGLVRPDVQRDPIGTEDPTAPPVPGSVQGPSPAPAPGAEAIGQAAAPGTGAGSMAAPPADQVTHPDLKPGDGPSTDVGILQQKLNGAGAATPALRITALYSEATTAAVMSFQVNHGLPNTGVTDQATWSALDKAAPNVVRNGRIVVDTPNGANPLGSPEKGITHPTIRAGSRGPAVEELQQRLNNAPPGEVPTMLEVDGKFGPITRKAVVEFQTSHPPLAKDGVVGPLTWAMVDVIPGAVSVGRVEFSSFERVEGNVYGGDTKYTWRLTDDALDVAVNINFTGLKSHPQVAVWLGQISTVWNAFKLVDDSTGKSLKLRLNANRASPGDASVRVYSAGPKAKNFRSDSANWNVQDPDAGLAPHEFGHLIGLQDEYRLGPDIYRATVGEEGKIGKVDGDADPAVIAGELWKAVTAKPATGRLAKTKKVINDHKLEPGAFSQRVAEAYEIAHAAELKREDADPNVGYKIVPNPGGTIDLDIAARIPGQDDEPEVTEPFTYTNRSIMGDMESLNNPKAQGSVDAKHDHPVEERHVRHFLQIVQANRPGSWRLERG